MLSLQTTKIQEYSGQAEIEKQKREELQEELRYLNSNYIN